MRAFVLAFALILVFEVVTDSIVVRVVGDYDAQLFGQIAAALNHH